MGELEVALETVRDRIDRYRGQVIGEQNTKSVLIDPILRALGWDIEDLDEVRREFRRKPTDNPVDYALFLMRTPRLFVEAKALRKDLDDDRWAKQIMGYASVTGVKWVVLTNGNEYRIYNSHATVPVEEKLFRRVVVASDESGVADALRLLSKAQLQDNQIDVLWSADFVDRQVRGIARGSVLIRVTERLLAPATTTAPIADSGRHPRQPRAGARDDRLPGPAPDRRAWSAAKQSARAERASGVILGEADRSYE